MLISVQHRTRYVYDVEARYAIQSLRLSPLSYMGQRVLEWSVTCPGIANALRFRDCFGNNMLLVTTLTPHKEITIEVNGLVEREDKAGMVVGLAEVTPARVFLRVTPQTEADAAIRDLAAASSGSDTVARLHHLMDLVRSAVDYVPGVTHAHTSAAEALGDGKGVCQDHAHIMIAAARVLGLPARYVTGYLIGEAEAGHAWAEIHVERLGWVGFDPANRICPTDHYVRVACGLDALSATPIRGIRRGDGCQEMTVDVEVVHQQQSQSQVQSETAQCQSQQQA